MMNRETAHWSLTAFPGGNYHSILDTPLAPGSPYKVRLIVVPIPDSEARYGFGVSVTTDRPDTPAAGLGSDLFPDDRTDWNNYPTRQEACQAAEAWLERNREQIPAVTEAIIKDAMTMRPIT